MSVVRCIAKILVVIGAINWGLVGFLQYDLVAHLFGGMSMMGARVVYSLVGLAGLYCLGCLFHKCCRCCKCGNGNCNCSSGGSCGTKKDWKN